MKLIVEADSVREFASKKTGQLFKVQVGGVVKEGRRVPERVEWFVRETGEMAPGEYAVPEEWFVFGQRGVQFQPRMPVAARRASVA